MDDLDLRPQSRRQQEMGFCGLSKINQLELFAQHSAHTGLVSSRTSTLHVRSGQRDDTEITYSSSEDGCGRKRLTVGKAPSQSELSHLLLLVAHYSVTQGSRSLAHSASTICM